MRWLWIITLAIAWLPVTGAAQSNDQIVDDINALNEALSILVAPSPDEMTIPDIDVEISLVAANGVWTSLDVKIVDGRLILPSNQTIALRVTSTDLLYEMRFDLLELEFFAIPGRIETVFINFEQTGLFYGDCAVTCGTQGAPLIFDVRDTDD